MAANFTIDQWNHAKQNNTEIYSRHNEEKHIQNTSKIQNNNNNKKNTHTTKNMVSVSKSMHFDKLDDIVNKHIHWL